ncbi:hypothetical protein KC19_7G173100 [Ceratodon purpureus]|uniref:DNA-3-methyladenine glycosylase II n=1 Tax=Ceratodon purpureus TaxID=3225 RepID=A0A8T0H937_CERPU|nr:hypothetical protein KC19_7G173100 [Ceratodon purpureus]
MADLGWPHTSTFLAEHEGCNQEFFHCGAVELARKLLGQFLYCHQSKVVVRILETEAYPEDEDIIYQKLFHNYTVPEMNAKFKIKGGTMVVWKPATTLGDHLYITAGEESCGDVVYLRSCEPIEGRHIVLERRGLSNESPSTTRNQVLIGPSRAAAGLGKEWESNPVLYEGGGVQLFHGTVPPREKILCGIRNLPHLDYLLGVNRGYNRFALKTRNPTYKYTNNETLREVNQ